MTEISPVEAIGIAARYAAQIRELLKLNTAAADALREIEADMARSENAKPDPTPETIDLRA